MTKKRNIIIIFSILIIFLIVWMLDLKTDIIKRSVEKTVPVEIYSSDGVKTGDTVVTIKGTYYPHLFRSDFYSGEFSLPELPETEQADTTAEIKWVKRRGYPEEPIIRHYGETVYEDLGSVFINIDREMDKIAWWTVKGTIASSYEEYQNYCYFKK